MHIVKHTERLEGYQQQETDWRSDEAIQPARFKHNNQAGRKKNRVKHELEYFAEDDFEESYGTRGMTLQLIELLTTLVQRPNVQEVVRQGVNPLLMTVSSYMLVEWRDEREYLCDSNLFLHDKS